MGGLCWAHKLTAGDLPWTHRRRENQARREGGRGLLYFGRVSVTAGRTLAGAPLAVFLRDVVDAGDGWEAAQSGVRPMVVVHVEPPREQVQACLVV